MGCCNCREGNEFLFSPRHGKSTIHEKKPTLPEGKIELSENKNEDSKENNTSINQLKRNNQFITKKGETNNNISLISDRTNSKLMKEDKENLRYQNQLKNDEEINASSVAKKLVTNLRNNQTNLHIIRENSMKFENDIKTEEVTKLDTNVNKGNENTRNLLSPKESQKENSANNTELFYKTFHSRNEKLINNKNEKDITILTIVDNPITIKDVTVDSNIISTNREQKNKEKLKYNLKLIECDITSPKKVEIIENKAEDISKPSTTTTQMKFEKGQTISNTESKRTKFFEKMNGMMKTQSQIEEKEKPMEKENKPLSHTMKLAEPRKSINIRSLIKNLENHMLGKKEVIEIPHSETKDKFVNLILEKPLTKINKKKFNRPQI